MPKMLVGTPLLLVTLSNPFLTNYGDQIHSITLEENLMS